MKTTLLFTAMFLLSLAAPASATEDEPKTGEIATFTCEAKFGLLAKSIAALPQIKILPTEHSAAKGG